MLSQRYQLNENGAVLFTLHTIGSLHTRAISNGFSRSIRFSIIISVVECFEKVFYIGDYHLCLWVEKSRMGKRNFYYKIVLNMWYQENKYSNRVFIFFFANE